MKLSDHDGSWQPKPVEYKRGKPKNYAWDEVQLCAQAICMEEMFNVRIERADFYYHEIRRRVPVELTDELRAACARPIHRDARAFQERNHSACGEQEALQIVLPPEHLCSHAHQEKNSGRQIHREARSGGCRKG